ncbi:MAG: hypothetical protein DRH33_07165 [Candidatus Nealsonbacteria bacterium]|nr:MAG: hypothetical protein DRH33_07165 [Candidatus Nealsonbacteria bacterium]
MKKFNKTKVGITVGIIFGIVDIIPMILMKMTWDTLLGAFSMCVIGGFLISTSNLKLNNTLKGTLIFFLIAVPMMIIVVAGSLKELIPMLVTNLVIGSLMGYFIGRFGEK